MQWFRMYAEFLTDPLIRMLSFDDQRHFIAALCLKASGVLDKTYPTPELRRAVIAQLMGLNEEGDKNALDATNSRLRRLGLIDLSWQPTNWEKRQFHSDSSTDRVRKYRQRHTGNDHETFQERSSNALEQNRTDTETEQKGAEAPVVHESLPKEAWGEWLSYRRQRRWPCNATTLTKQLGILQEFDTDTQRKILNNSIQSGWQGVFPLKGINGSKHPDDTGWKPPPDEPKRAGVKS